jgi:hypothetical protein
MTVVNSGLREVWICDPKVTLDRQWDPVAPLIQG